MIDLSHPFDHVECAVCGRRVDYIATLRNVFTDTTEVYVACHGAEESFVIESAMALAAGRITIGRAFESQPRQLAPTPTPKETR